MKRINTEKFIKYLEGEIVLRYRLESDALGKGNYNDAQEAKTEGNVFTFIKGLCTGEDQHIEIGEFMEDNASEVDLK